MIEINAENLEWAFRKLKTHYYYYYSSNYLKGEIIDFENNILCGKLTFQSIADTLLKYSADKTSNYRTFFKSNYIIYPKKNSFKNCNNEFSLNSYNCFIDVDLCIHLVDVLFCLELIEKIGINNNRACVYGGRIDPRLLKAKSIIESNFLYENYRNGYQKWIHIPDAIASKKTSEDNISVIRTDIASCFYSIEFDFDEFLSIVGIDSDSSTIMKNIFNIYTYKVKDGKLKENKVYRKVILPIGLLSSQIILNYVLADFDEAVRNNINVVEYGRYVDDMIIVVKGDAENKTYDFVFNEILKPSFEKEKDGFKLSRTKLLNCDLFLNKEKTHIRLLPNNLDKYDFDDLLESVSFCDFIDSYRDNSPVQFFKDYSNSDVRNNVYDVFYEPNERIYNMIMSIPGETLLNCFSFWNDIFKSFKNSSEKTAAIFNRINSLIKKISNRELPSKSVKQTLGRELEVSLRLSSQSPKQLCYFSELDLNDLVELIGMVKNGNYKYQPMIFSLVELSLYYSFETIDDMNCDIKTNTLALYRSINCVDSTDSYPINGYAFNYCDNKRDIKRKNEPEKEENNTVRIAVAALNMDGLEESDLLGKAPAGYKLDDILRIIKSAHKRKAEYILLPEFALESRWLLRVLKEARKNHISLISGLIHCRKTNNLVYNITVIYDYLLGIVLLKEKNYMSPDEKKLITFPKPKGMGCNYHEPALPYYYIIDDGRICFSTMTCYEATNVCDRAELADKINVLFMPVYNYDTHYFSNIINSLSRDISCYIIQANSNKMGDSKIRMPVEDALADKVRIKGGINNYCVVDEIDISLLEKENNDFLEKLDEISKGKIEPKDNKKKIAIKPLSAGNHHHFK